MPIFKYKAKKMTGEETEGAKEAEDKFELARELKKEGYIIVSSEEGTARKENPVLIFILSLIRRISVAEKMLFSRNLAVMLSAGLPISRALTALSRQTRNKKFKKVIADLEAEIQKGEPLSMAMDQHPEVFSALFAAMVRSGEKSGKLPESLNLISRQLEREMILKRRIKGALMYPMIIFAAMIGVGIVMMIFVVPTLVSVFTELNVELPLSTKIVIFTSSFLVNNLFLASLTVFAVIVFVFWALRAKRGKRLLDAVFLRLPFFSSLVKKINSSRTTRTLSSLIGAGVDIIEAFDVAKSVVGNHYYQEVLEKAKAEIQKGQPIAQVFLAAENLYPPLVGEMVAVGEETGELSNMLLRLADFYEEEVGETTKNLTTIIEPILMIFIGAVVGFFAVSMIQPMYSMMGGL
ncbi:MAG: hypothetical protein A3A10_01340 [Candidatus Tagabacteria bacterium RIFCSPLOWO2_01_FULL_42_9]|uniref:Type II secretion system protein GspF domain-containing protein n=1 Tax=Candidatus Tagabacteria bacterium RIFCSPLOWO2_01_FULL_42_9 TaxID=1802296 RepID=A0A1G2LT32_9BACT|nr:MAG: hypothetical protein A3A10_01340 [Candidatus Tagabacteria bacterium RIFCSPLOWO2_01_FULL_42_9]